MKPPPSSTEQTPKAAPDTSSPSQGTPDTHESAHLELAALWSMLDQDSSAPDAWDDPSDATPKV